MSGALSQPSWSLILICLGSLMVDLDTTIVAVAMPTISTELALSDTSIIWLVNVYTLIFGGTLLLGGALSDVYGGRRAFLAGIAVFTGASAMAALANGEPLLLLARAIQGLGAALVTAVSLALIVRYFPEGMKRAKAIGIYGFVCASGGSGGEVLGGALTKSLGWHWIFLINLPIGVIVYAGCAAILPRDRPIALRRVDSVGALTGTLGLMGILYVLNDRHDAGGFSIESLSVLIVSGVLLTIFVLDELLFPDPILPLRLFRSRSFAVVNVVTILWSAATLPWFVLTALFAQRVLNYDPLRVGLTFLPAAIITALISVGFSARLIMRFGARKMLSGGLILTGAALFLFGRVTAGASFVSDLLPGVLLMGIGSGMAFNALLVVGMREVKLENSAVASGVINSLFMLGGAFGLSCLVGLAAWRAQRLEENGVNAISALIGGYQLAFLAAGAVSTLAGTLAAIGLRSPSPIRTAVEERRCGDRMSTEVLISTDKLRTSDRESSPPDINPD